MPAWKHTASWNDARKAAYRKEVSERAKFKAGTEGLDCADLSNSLLIDFAEKNGLPVTFKDNDDVEYASLNGGQSPYREIPIVGHRMGKTWSTKSEYADAVIARIGTESLSKKNLSATDQNPILPGYLMIAYKGNMHHTSLVYRVYGPGESHPQEKHTNIPDFPGDEVAVKQVDQWYYFRGTILEEKDDKVTRISRAPDKDVHIDYLNYRSRRKDRAELIMFANARQMREDGFQFRWYLDDVFT